VLRRWDIVAIKDSAAPGHDGLYGIVIDDVRSDGTVLIKHPGACYCKPNVKDYHTSQLLVLLPSKARFMEIR
jgi:hypothetical protein